MATKSNRIFVGNLPQEVTRDEIVRKFRQYGNVESVEIKTKKDTSSGQVLATFCYVNLNTDNDTLGNCILLLNAIKWGDRHIKVEVAKESFLQRLQRERQTAIKTMASQQTSSELPLVDSSKHAGNLKKEKKAPVENVEGSKGSNSSVSFISDDGDLRSCSSSAQKKKKISKKIETSRKKDSSSSDTSDSEDDSKNIHPSSKLPMFKGVKSITSRESVSKGFSQINNNEEIIIIQEAKTARKIPPQTNFHADASSNILKKFESFSDVWKDADEPSHLEETSSRLSRKGGKRHDLEENSFKAQGRGWQTQRESFSSRATNNAHQESNLTDSNATNIAEQKRLRSLDAKCYAFEQQKKAVKLALSDKGSSPMNKKIVFDDDNNDSFEPKVVQVKPNKDLKRDFADPSNRKRKALTLFNESDDETMEDNWAGDFKIKKQFEGEKGKKLQDLQNRYNNDERFKLDERFYDNDDEHKLGTSSKSVSKTKQPEEGIEGLAEEREQQLQILSSILGKPISVSHPSVHQESKIKGMLRFDPLKPNHLKYELSKEVKENKKKKKSKASDTGKKEDEVEGEDEDEDGEEPINPQVRRDEKEPEPVSQNKFYSVSDSLAESLRLSKGGQSSGFSLLQMFGSSNTPPVRKQTYTEVSTNKEGLKRPPTLEDSSTDDEANDAEGPTALVSGSVSQHASSGTSGVRPTAGVWQESFFLQPNDSRLKEGSDFFTQIDDPSDTAKFGKKREALRHIVKQKIRKNNRKANSFKTKVGALWKKSSLWPKSVPKTQKPRRRHPN